MDKPDPSQPPNKRGYYYGYADYNKYAKDMLARYKWEPNQIFFDKLEFVSAHPTKGSAHLIFKSQSSGRKFSFFLSDFEDVMKNKKLIDGSILDGEFTFVKRGSSQGIRMIIE